MRYIIEGEWTGYNSSQQRIVHREVYKSYRKVSPFIESIRKLHSIRFTDGTSLLLSVREAKPREKVTEVKGYTSLIRDCVYKGVSSVAELVELRKPTPQPTELAIKEAQHARSLQRQICGNCGHGVAQHEWEADGKALCLECDCTSFVGSIPKPASLVGTSQEK